MLKSKRKLLIRTLPVLAVLITGFVVYENYVYFSTDNTMVMGRATLLSTKAGMWSPQKLYISTIVNCVHSQVFGMSFSQLCYLIAFIVACGLIPPLLDQTKTKSRWGSHGSHSLNH